MREQISTVNLIRLKDAPGHYPQMGLKVQSLRTERDKGNLTTYLIAGKEYTTLADMEEMFRRCAVTPRGRASGSDPSAGTGGAGSHTAKSGSSATAPVRSAQAAARLIVKALKGGSPDTSPPSSAPKGEAQ